jgi:hypothetical protein
MKSTERKRHHGHRYDETSPHMFAIVVPDYAKREIERNAFFLMAKEN